MFASQLTQFSYWWHCVATWILENGADFTSRAYKATHFSWLFSVWLSTSCNRNLFRWKFPHERTECKDETNTNPYIDSQKHYCIAFLCDEMGNEFLVVFRILWMENYNPFVNIISIFAFSKFRFVCLFGCWFKPNGICFLIVHPISAKYSIEYEFREDIFPHTISHIMEYWSEIFRAPHEIVGNCWS